MIPVQSAVASAVTGMDNKSSMKARGLTVFITDIRACTSKQQEEERVEKELANIRNKFSLPTTVSVGATGGKAGLDSYQKKKYVWKLVYIHMLGYDVDFGHMQIIDLLSSHSQKQVYSEKHVGYLAASVLLRNQSEMMMLIVNTVRMDLQNQNEYIQCLALACVANLGGKELTNSLSSDVQRVLSSPKSSGFVKKKAALTLLRMFRTNQEVVIHTEMCPIVHALLENSGFGVVLSAAALLQELVLASPETYVSLRNVIVKIISRLVVKKMCSADYLFCGTACPFLVIRLLEILQSWDHPTKETEESALLTESLYIIGTRTEVTKNVNKNNADHAILFSAINLIIHYADDAEAKLRDLSVKLLGKFVCVREPNIRYLGLAGMSKLALMAQREGKNEILDNIRSQQEAVLYSLKDVDVSIRKRALDVLFAMSNQSNVVQVVGELLTHLSVADFLIKEEMVLKIAILAERYAQDQRWYVDTVLQLVTLAGDNVSEDTGHRLVKAVMGKEDLQRYAAEAMYRAMQPQHVHETTVKIAAYILGEFGYMLGESEKTEGQEKKGGGVELIVSGVDLFRIIHKHFWAVGPQTKAILLHSYGKLLNLYEELDGPIKEVFAAYRDALDVELQQRACEYLALAELGTDKLNQVFEPIPPWPEAGGSEISPITGKPTSQGRDASLSTIADSPKKNAAVAKKAAAEMNLIDLDLMGTPPSTAPVSGGGDLLGLSGVGNSNNSSPGGVMDLLGGAVPSATTGNTIVTIPPSMMPKVKGWFMVALVKPKSILYEDDIIQVGMQREFSDDTGRMMIFFGNKSPIEVFEEFTVAIPDSGPFLKVTQVLVPSATTMQPLGQERFGVGLECMGPFTNPPELRVSFVKPSTREQVCLSLRLPVSIFDFVTPTSMPEERWEAQWNDMHGSNNEAPSATLTPTIDMTVARDRCMKAFDLYHLGHNIPLWDETSVTGCGVLRTGVVNPNTGEKGSFGIMARLKPSGTNTFQLEVRANHAAIAKACQLVLSKAAEYAVAPPQTT